MTVVLYFWIENMVRVSPLMLGWSYQPPDRQQQPLSTLKAPRLLRQVSQSSDGHDLPRSLRSFSAFPSEFQNSLSKVKSHCQELLCSESRDYSAVLTNALHSHKRVQSISGRKSLTPRKNNSHVSQR